MNEQEKAYLAGLWDGEGTITLTFRHQSINGYEKEFFTPIVSVCNTEKDVIEWTVNTIGAGSVLYKAKQKGNHKACYWSRLRGINDIEKFIKDIIPYIHMNRKKKLALLMLEWIKLHKKAKSEQRPNCKGGERFKFSEREYEIVKEMNELNRKGVN